MSKYFSRSEFSCNCGCGFNTVDFELIQMLDGLRENFDKPIHITSGCRCEDYNAKVGGSVNSQHLLGRAADIQVKDIDPAIVYEIADKMGFGGAGCYATFTHVDTRDGKARWEG